MNKLIIDLSASSYLMLANILSLPNANIKIVYNHEEFKNPQNKIYLVLKNKKLFRFLICVDEKLALEKLFDLPSFNIYSKQQTNKFKKELNSGKPLQ